MASIAKLVVSLGANTASFETDMQRASRNHKKRMKEMERTARAAARGLAVAFTAAAAGMTAVVRSSTETADVMQKMAGRLGTSTEALSELSHVADLSGVQFNQLTIGMQRMERRIAEVAKLGKGAAKEALDALGLSAKKLAELPVDKQFEAVAEELSKVDNQAEKVRLAFKLFDSEGVALIQTMGEGAAGIQKMRAEAARLGLTIGQDLADASAAFNDNMTRMTGLAKGASLQFTDGLLPALIDVQEYFVGGAKATDFFRNAGEKLGAFLKQLIGAFIVLRHAVEALIRLLIAAADLIFQSFKAITAPIVATTQQLAKAFDQLAQGNVKQALTALGDIAAASGKKYTTALGRMENATQEMAAAAAHVKAGMDKAVKVMQGTEQQAKETAGPIIDVADSMSDLTDASNDMTESQEKATEETDEYEKSLQSLLDTLYPLEAELRRHGDQLDLLERAYQKGDLSLLEYADAMLRTVSAMEQAQIEAKQTEEDFDLLTTAIDEGVRILQRSFHSMWEGLLDGSQDVFSSVADGFRSLLSNLVHQASTQQIILGVQSGFQGGFNQQNMRQIGEGIATFAAVILGAKLGGGGRAANTGAALGSVAGGIAASVIPGLGTILGSSIGALLGGLFGGIFDKKPRIGAGGFDIEPGDTKFFNTALGGVFVGDTKGGMDEFVAEFGAAIIEFDKSIGAVLSNEQLGSVGEILEKWSTEKKGKFASIEEILKSRFSAILTTFDQNINAFTRKGQDLVEQVDRFTVAVSAQNLITEVPELFTGRDVNDILAVVSAMQTGIMTIADAWNAFTELLTIVVSIRDALVDFAGSDLGEDFQTVLDAANLSLSDALTGMTAALMDAIRDFDGSPEQLQNIGLMVSAVREGEIKLLSQIDAIQKGIQANLETLRAEMLGLRDGPRTDEQLFLDAQRFINSISSATSADEIAELERQFSAAIRAMSPESQASNMASILQMIDTFRAASDTALEGMRQAVLDSAKSTREMVQEFIDRIGDPLDIIAGTNTEIRDALQGGGDVIESDMQHETNMEGILEEGVGEISASVASIGPAVATALRGALGDVEINVTVHTGGGLTNQ